MFADVAKEMEKMDLDISVEEALKNTEQPEAKKLLTKLSRANKRAMIQDDIETIKEMKGEDKFATAYDKFQEEYGDYNFYDEDGCDVYLEVSGAVLGDNILIDYPTKDYWKDKRVLVTAFGIGSIEEAKKLKISQDIERIWMGEYRQFYEE